MNFEKCQTIFDNICRKKKLHDAVILIENKNGTVSWNSGYNKTIDSPMNMASITKLFVTTCILQLYEQSRLQPEEKISNYLDASIMNGLHIYKGKDYSGQLTISDLLYQKSGLPDYFLKKPKGSQSFEKMAYEKDVYIPFHEMIRVSKSMKPAFAPRKKGRAYYADLNFDLLGKILETIYDKTLPEIFEEKIFNPLKLEHTYVVTEEKDFAPLVYAKGKAHPVSNFLRSCPASGGGVTTARELMIFLKAFRNGILFSKELLTDMKEHNRLQLVYGELEYSGGHMYIHAGYPFVKKNVLRGHSGSTCSLAYYCEETDLYFVGDLNDNRPYLPVNMMLKMEYRCRD